MSNGDAWELGRTLRDLLSGFAGEQRKADIAAPSEQKQEFPQAGIDAFLSHFVFTFRINKGNRAGELFSYTWPAAIQSVARTDPFFFNENAVRRPINFPLPKESQLPRSASLQDFLTVPPKFFDEGKETIFLQILNLDARGETPYGPMRCILGETFKREYPDIFQPSYGAAQSLAGRGLPGKLFFVPNGIFETPFGPLHTRPKALLGSHITSVPPIGSSPSLLQPIPLDSVDELRAFAKEGRSLDARALEELEPAATLVALAHPIDALLFEAGDAAFSSVERAISRAA